MNLYEQWNELCAIPKTPEQQKAFWDDYFKEETKVYKKILAEKSGVYEAAAAELAKRFGIDEALFPAFLEGINTSLKVPVDFKTVTPESNIYLDIDFEKLFYNMNDAKAKWLYTLPEWDAILSIEKRYEITREWRKSGQAVSEKTVGRNDLCPCGSGKKYKKCCMQKENIENT